jgi:glycosyltransferase involved in cell wall biosynthesis
MAVDASGPPGSILFAVTEDWYFVSHRKALAEQFLQQGIEVSVAARFGEHEMALRRIGFDCFRMPFERSLRRPWRDLRAAFTLAKLARKAQPDIVQLVSFKPILLSLLGVYTSSRTQWVAAITGMGYLFSSKDSRARWFKYLVLVALRLIMRAKNVSLLVQNSEDRDLLIELRVTTADRIALIAGVGIDLDQFPRTPLPVGEPIVLLPARLLRDKGIEEFVTAARALRARSVKARFVLVGAVDVDNPAAIAVEQLEAWCASSDIEWWGHRADMADVYRQASIVCLPSYREGLPKVLLEAAACGRPLVATDVAGCRDVCRDAVNGFLVPARDPVALASAIADVLAEPARWPRLAAAGRQMVEREYDVKAIARQTLSLYRKLLLDQGSSA